MRFTSRLVPSFALAALFSASAFGQSSTDVFNGSTIGTGTGTYSVNGASADGMLGGFTGLGSESGNTIFTEFLSVPSIVDPLRQVYSIEFFPPSGSVSITGITLYLQSDGPGSTTRAGEWFSLIADSNNDTFITAADDFVSSTLAYEPDGSLEITVPFIATANRFYFEIDPAATSGPRVIELDAIVPEPASLGLLAVSGLLLGRRRGLRK